VMDPAARCRAASSRVSTGGLSGARSSSSAASGACASS
jgi:hypothetical protein